jgi:hypothetical protein
VAGLWGPPPAVRFYLSFAAVAAVPTVALGWAHAAAGSEAGSPQLLFVHRWLGTAAGVWVVGAALWTAWGAHRGAVGRSVQLALVVVGALLVGAAAHAGGALAHGSDFLDW